MKQESLPIHAKYDRCISHLTTAAQQQQLEQSRKPEMSSTIRNRIMNPNLIVLKAFQRSELLKKYSYWLNEIMEVSTNDNYSERYMCTKKNYDSTFY